MKKAFLFILLASTSAMMPVIVFGQDYEPFLKESKIWNYLYENPAGTSYMYSRVVSGDTTINDLTYKKVYDISSGDYQYALREDGKKVYCKFQNSEISQLLYDFGKNAGEIISEKEDKLFKSIIKVLSVDTVKSGERFLRRMEVGEYHFPLDYSGNYEDYNPEISIWIEGIGSSCDLVCPFRYDGNYNNFYSCLIGEDILGDQNLFWAPGITAIPVLKEDNLSLPVYDLQGRRLSAQPTKGIYIQNGKKMGLRTLP